MILNSHKSDYINFIEELVYFNKVMLDSLQSDLIKETKSTEIMLNHASEESINISLSVNALLSFNT